MPFSTPGGSRFALSPRPGLRIELNDARLRADDDELEELTLAVARGELDAERAAIWFRQRLEREP